MSAIPPEPHIVIAGAGSIGCYVGGRLLQQGQSVSFLGRARIKAELAEHGLRLTQTDTPDHVVSADAVEMSTAPDLLARADIILVTVKSGDTAEIATLIDQHAGPDAIIVSLQNGVSNADCLRATVGNRRVIAGMVPYNVAALGDGRFHQGTSGAIQIASDEPGLLGHLSGPHLHVVESDDMPAVMWGKLLINLNNALNALSGLPLKQQIETRAWRKLLADQQSETFRVLEAAGITPRAATPIPPKYIPMLMRLPTPIFKIIAVKMVKIDPLARSSMWEDLERGRKTEIDELQGAVISLAESVGLSAPVCARIAALIKDAEAAKAGSPQLDVRTIRAGL